MAIGAAAVATSDSSGYAGRVTVFVVAACVAAGMGGVIFGYDIGVSGGVSSMAPFLKKFFPEVYRRMSADTKISNYCKFDSQLLTAFTSSLYVAGLITAFFASRVTASRGRRPSMVLGGIAYMAGAAVSGAAANVYMVIIGRVLLGVGLGFSNQAVPLYLSEMAPPRHRGAFSNGFQCCVGIGALTANLINFGTEKIAGGWGWRLSLSLAALPAALLFTGALLLPETPNSLIQQGRAPEAVKPLLRKIRGTDDVDGELEDIVAAKPANGGSSFTAMLSKRRYRPQLAMAVALPFFQQVTGINVVAFYTPELLRSVGMGESASLISAVITGVVGTASTLVSMIVVDRFGRRALLIAGGVQMFVSQLIIGLVMATKLPDHGEMSKGYAYALIVMIGVYVAGFGWSWGPLGWLVPSEIFPMEIRSAGQSIVVAVNFLFTIFVAQAFLTMLCHMRFWIFFFFAAWLAVMTVFVWLLLPETKGIPIEQVARVWRRHWFWKQVVAGDDEDDERTY